VSGGTNPTITNTGVLTVTAGLGIVNTGSANAVVLENTGAVQLQAGNGISITGSAQFPTITNIGVRAVQKGAGISIDNTNPNIPTISNDGVLTVNQGAGVIVDNTDPHNPIVSAAVGSVNQIIQGGGPGGIIQMVPTTCSVGGQAIVIVVPNGILASYLATGPPSATGVFLLNFTGFNLFFTNTSGSPAVGQRTVGIAFFDSVRNVTYSPGQTVGLSTTALYPINATMPVCIFDVTAARTAGLRTLNQIVFTNNTNSPFVLPSTNIITAVYYPNGLQ